MNKEPTHKLLIGENEIKGILKQHFPLMGDDSLQMAAIDLAIKIAQREIQQIQGMLND